MSYTTPLKVAIVNDFEVVVRGVHAMLAPFADRVKVVELAAQSEVSQKVDLTLYDTFSQPQVDGDEFDDVIAETEPGAVVVYTWNVDPALVEVALSKGCRGYLDKSLGGQDLVSALERVAAGEIVVSPTTIAPLPDPRVNGDWPGRGDGLSAREAEIVTLITQGLTNADIAARTFLSINSVKTYIRSAYRKMGVARRSQAVRWGLEHGMSPDVVRRVDPDPEASRRVVAENGEPGGSAQAGTKTTTE